MWERKEAKRWFNRVALALLLSSAVFILGMVLTEGLEGWLLLRLKPSISQPEYQKFFQTSGLSLIIGAGLSVFPPWLILRKENSQRHFDTPAGIPAILGFLLMVQGLQIITAYLAIPLEYMVNAWGYTTSQAAELASGGASSVTMLLYSVMVAPVCEELIYRGALLRGLMPLGRSFAIIISALMFGLMHQNIIQFSFASLAGLLFGYIAERYTLLDAIVVHACTNFTSEVFSVLLEHNEDFWTIQVFVMLMGLAVLWTWLVTRGKEVLSYCQEIYVEAPVWPWFFTSIFVLLYIVSTAVLTVYSLSPL